MTSRPAYILAATTEMLIATSVYVLMAYLPIYHATHDAILASIPALAVLGGLLNNSWVKFLNSVGVPAVPVQAPTEPPAVPGALTLTASATTTPTPTAQQDGPSGVQAGS